MNIKNVFILSGLSTLLLVSKIAAQNPHTEPTTDYNIVANQFDVNGWDYNPKWMTQTLSPSSLPNPYTCNKQGSLPTPVVCTTQHFWIDKSGSKCPDNPFQSVWFPGHINFVGATFEGSIDWSSHSGNDDDYNIALFPDDQSGLTAVNPDHIEMEFDSDETIDHFHTSWWKDFHAAVDDGDDEAHKMLFGKRCIAFGIFGLDCAHDCASELHPVLALAIEVDKHSNSNTWAIFVRNWGNEGYCSSGLEVLDPSINTYSFKINKPGATKVTVTNSEFLCRGLGGWGPDVQLIPNEGAIITFGFPPPDSRERINGVLTLKWEVSKLKTPLPVSNKKIISVITHRPEEKEYFEEKNEILKKRMTKPQKLIYSRYKPRREIYFDEVPAKKPAPQFLLNTHKNNNGQLAYNIPSKEREVKESSEQNAILKAFNGKIPDVKYRYKNKINDRKLKLTDHKN